MFGALDAFAAYAGSGRSTVRGRRAISATRTTAAFAAGPGVGPSSSRVSGFPKAVPARATG
ncbi:hypothetical protein [Actinomadura litoris]|uniref:hypothetical protein n=1 Tax=Actinomadura litoris TaxID=2678616 RepID=UPI001FA6E1D9|nr:hypothetical protein [Actinomadura litoris]